MGNKTDGHGIFKRGFTFLELIVVVVLVGIVLAVTVSGIGNFQTSSQDQDAVSRISQMLRTAREQSIARLHNETHGVYVTTGIGGTVTLFEGSSYAGRTAAYDQIYTLPAGMNITSVSMTGNTLIFSLGLGYPMSGVNESIGLQHVATRVANTITINTWGMITW